MQYNEKNTNNQLVKNKPEKAPLGNYAKSSALSKQESRKSKGLQSKKANTLFSYIDEKTGECIEFENTEHGQIEKPDHDQIITERFLLQSSAAFLMPDNRISKCTRLSTGGAGINLHKSVEHKTVSYSGLQTCGSVWCCPICAAKISERRKNEVVSALEQHLDDGGQLYFITFTFPHTNSQSLTELITKQRQAFKFLRQSKSYRKLKKHLGYSGLIRALEVTWGIGNGWHPHTHEIFFCKQKVSFHSIKTMLFQEWKKSCLKAGLPAPSARRGIDVKGGDKAGEYITKYGYELTKSHTKKARGERFSPFDLLRGYFHDQDKFLGARFVEFTDSMQGARQLYWTNGLKDKFGINDKTDEELAREMLDDQTDMGLIELEKWKAVVKYKHRASVKILAQNHGFAKVSEFIESLYLEYCISGDQQADVERIQKNADMRRLGFKSKKEYENYLTEQASIFTIVDNNTQFYKLKYEKANDPDLVEFAKDVHFKIEKSLKL